MSADSRSAGMESTPSVNNSGAETILPLNTDLEGVEQSPISSQEKTPSANKVSQSTLASSPIDSPMLTTDPVIPPLTDNSIQSAAIQMVQDKDLIEKEWVNRAKAIVENTRENPYKQAESLSMLKADYMKKEFNKTIKLDK